MQNLIVGKSGSGKGYEVCAYHIFSALAQGRKVVTNMPLVISKWASLDPSFPALIDIRKRALPIRGTWEPTREEGAFHLFANPDEVIQQPTTARPFSGVWDYYDTWRHPETGTGALFVIDEAQNVIPRGKTDVEVEEWSALHRHFVSDVIFMTQSYGKLSQAIRDNIQIVYRLTKKVAWGQIDRYIRKVQDGIRGEVLNTTERKYNPVYFGLWRSQTQGGSGEEFGAEDIVPYWKHWTFKGLAICLCLFFALVTYQLTKVDKKPAPVVKAKPAAEKSHQRLANPVSDAPALVTPTRGPEEKHHPYDGLTLHLQALLKGKRSRDGVDQDYLSGYVTIAQNGQGIRLVSFDDLRTAGYIITFESSSVISLTYKGFDVGFVVADLPQVGLASKVPANEVAKR
ncbi:MAG: zonular occludens toxin domain-containing protein [Pyrinomonadaceae bacterium]